MPSATKAYAALREAMRDTVPSCQGDARFTSENADPVPLIEICAGCPLFGSCRDLANIDNPIPVFGVLAGRVRRGNRSSVLMNERAMSRLVGA